MKAAIHVEDASLTFLLSNNRSPKLKEFAVTTNPVTRSMMSGFEIEALKEINLSIISGERVGIIGFNGSGKSTLLKLMLGIYHPTAGEVDVRGSVLPLLDLSGNFEAELTGRENIFLNAAYFGLSPAQVKPIEHDIIDFAEIAAFIDMPVKYYSTGMVVRLAFGIATMLPTDILLLDEIFAVGDGYFMQKAERRMRSLIDKTQIVVMISHNPGHLRAVCNRIIWLHGGKIVADGDVEELLAAYASFIAHKNEFGVEDIEAALSAGCCA